MRVNGILNLMLSCMISITAYANERSSEQAISVAEKVALEALMKMPCLKGAGGCPRPQTLCQLTKLKSTKSSDINALQDACMKRAAEKWLTHYLKAKEYLKQPNRMPLGTGWELKNFQQEDLVALFRVLKEQDITLHAITLPLLTYDIAKVLVKHFKTLDALELLGGNKGFHIEWNALETLLKAKSLQLKSLALLNGTIGPNGETLGKALSTSKLKALVLRNTNLGDDEVKRILFGISDVALDYLELSGNTITSQGLKNILKSLPTTLTSLHLGNNQISDEGLIALLKETKLDSQLPQLETIFLNNNPITGSFTAEVQDIQPNNPLQLDLQGNRITPNFTEAVQTIQQKLSTKPPKQKRSDGR